MSLGEIEYVGKFGKQHTKFLLDMLGPASPKDGLQTPTSSAKVRVAALKAALFQDVVEETLQLIRELNTPVSRLYSFDTARQF